MHLSFAASVAALPSAVERVQVVAPRSFHDASLWPEFQALSEELRKHSDITERAIRETIYRDTSEAIEREAEKAPPELPSRTEQPARRHNFIRAASTDR